MILVTGAPGKTGLALLRALAAVGAPARALIHKADYEDRVRAAGASEVRLGDLEKPADMQKALQGADALYLIIPNMHPREAELGRRIVAQAAAAGLPRLVYHSVLYPQIEAMPHHWAKLRVEEALIASGLPFTILQPAAYMQNILGYWDSIVNEGRYQLPYAVGAKSTPVDLDDVAAVAAKALTEDGYQHASFELCGPETLSASEQAAQIGEHLGQPVAVEAISLEEWQRGAGGLPAYARDMLSQMFGYYDRHGFAGNGAVLEQLLGRPPTRFRQFLERIDNLAKVKASEARTPSQG